MIRWLVFSLIYLYDQLKDYTSHWKFLENGYATGRLRKIQKQFILSRDIFTSSPEFNSKKVL